jgi:hypothetical protein
VNRADIARAKRFCEGLRPELERYKAAHGAYPKELSEIRLPGPLPRLLDEHSFFRSSGDAYSFNIIDHGGLMNGFAYDSPSGIWVEWD